jgi:hypothetical protein
MKKLKENMPLIIMLFSLFFMFLPWYASVFPDPITMTLQNMNGFEVMRENQYALLIHYFLCIVIQFMAIQQQNKMYIFIFPILAQGIFVSRLIFFFVPFEYGITFSMGLFKRVHIGCFLMIVTLIICIFLNLKKLLTYQKGKLEI